MAIEATAVYWNHPDRLDAEAARLRPAAGALPRVPNLKLCRTADESRAINAARHHAIVVAGSGMCNGGRILHHLQHNLWRPECHVIITSFQAPGTLGRALVERVPYVRIHGDEIKVAATVHTLGGLSAHGDRRDLLQWYSSFASRPPVYLVHGEPEVAEKFSASLRAAGAVATATRPGMRVDLAALPAVGAA
jgi:metallo-beta-lactamase family protein